MKSKNNIFLNRLLVFILSIISYHVLSVELPQKPVISYFFPRATNESDITNTFSAVNMIDALDHQWTDTNEDYWLNDVGNIMLRRVKISYDNGVLDYSSAADLLDNFRGAYEDGGVTKYTFDEKAYDGIAIDEALGGYIDTLSEVTMFIDALEDFRALYPNKLIVVYSAGWWINFDTGVTRCPNIDSNGDHTGSGFSAQDNFINGIKTYADILAEEIYPKASASIDENWEYERIRQTIDAIKLCGGDEALSKTAIILGVYDSIRDRSDVDIADHLQGMLQYIKNDSVLQDIGKFGIYAPHYATHAELKKINKAVVDTFLCQMYLKFDESSGFSAKDLSGLDNNGTLQGFTTPNWTAGKFGNALEFDGVSNFINCGSSSSLELDEWTYALWIKPDTVSKSYQGLLCKGVIWDKGFYISNGNLRGSVRQATANATAVANGVITADEWQHVAMTYKNGEIKLFLNGQQLTLDGSTTGSGVLNTGTSFYVGYNGSYAYDGFMDDVRVYANALSTADINRIYKDAPMQLRFRLDEPSSSSTTKDSSNHGNTGTLNNFSTSTCWVSGKSGNALQFDGADDYVDCGADSSLELGEWTYSVWIKPDTVAKEYQQIIAKDILWSKGLFLNNTNLRGQVGHATTNAEAKANGVITANEWQHIAMTYKDGIIKLYRNGELLSLAVSITGAGNITDCSSSNLRLGYGSSSYAFDGAMDDVRVYSRELAPDEIVDNYSDSPYRLFLAMDESSGSTTADTSGFDHDGTLTNFNTSTCWVSGVSGNALEFDGSDDRVYAGSGSSLEPAQWTYTAWIMPYTIDKNCQNIICKSTVWDRGFYINNGNLCASARQSVSNATAKVDGIISANEWQHVAMTYKDGEIKLYRNGQLLSLSTQTLGSGDISSDVNVYLGSTSSSYAFDGVMDEVRVYSRDLSESDINTLYREDSWYHLELAMDETSGTTAQDTSGFDNDGTLYNFPSTCWVTGISGNALEFDGANDIVFCGASGSDLTFDKWTYAVWIKPDTITKLYQQIIGKPMYKDKGLYINNGNLCGYIKQSVTDATAVASNVITANEWQHVAMTYENGQIKLYRNGQLLSVSSVTGSGSLNTTSSQPLIGYNSSSYAYDGLMDNFRIYSKVLSADKINVIYQKDSFYCLELSMDESSGTTATDTSGFFNDGTLSGFSTPNWTTGVSGNALEFDGTDDFINCGSDSSLELDEWTYAVWVKPHTITKSYQTIMCKGVIWDKGFYINNGNLCASVRQASVNASAKVNGILTANQWQHVAMTYKNGEIKLFLNGQQLTLDTSTTGSGDLNTGTSFYVGYNGSYAYDGLMDDARVYSRELSAAEINVIYQQNN